RGRPDEASVEVEARHPGVRCVENLELARGGVDGEGRGQDARGLRAVPHADAAGTSERNARESRRGERRKGRTPLDHAVEVRQPTRIAPDVATAVRRDGDVPDESLGHA